MVGPKGSKNKVKPLEKPKRKANKGGLLSPVIATAAGRKVRKNKFSRDLKEAYLPCGENAAGGGLEGLVGYLKKQALLENPSLFMTGLSKLLPMMLRGNPDAPLIVERVYYTDERTEAHVQACSSISLWFTRANLASIETWEARRAYRRG